jgi:ubiquinol-cytochrome c reductase cytochrome c subunit
MAYPEFAAYCRHPTAEMPPYSVKILSDADLASIYAYLQSLPDPPAAKSIPILNEPAKKTQK